VPSNHFPLARLIQLISLLQAGRCPNARQLAEICEVSRRTVYRDLATLANAGVTVLYRPDKQGYELARSLFLQPARLEEKEALALLAYSRQWRHADDLGLFWHANQAVDKLVQGLPEELRQRLRNASEILSESIDPPAVTTERVVMYEDILAALAQRCQIRVWITRIVAGGRQELETTKVGIYRLPLLGGQWHLVGRSSLHCRVMQFPVARIERVELTSDSYAIPPRFSLARFLAQEEKSVIDGSRYTAVIRLNSEVFSKLGALHSWRASRPLAMSDGTVQLILEATSADDLLAWVLGLGHEVEIVKPDELRLAIHDLAERISRRNTPTRLMATLNATSSTSSNVHPCPVGG
jgi:predicted DNA-binding transcriptional regulator YafY